jgi:hypothetical protein
MRTHRTHTHTKEGDLTSIILFFLNQESGLRIDPSDISYEDADWIHLFQDGDKWWHLVNRAMNLRA